MRLRQQHIQLASLQADVHKQAEELSQYKQLVLDYEQQVTGKDEQIRAKDGQLVQLRAELRQQAKLLADAQQKLVTQDPEWAQQKIALKTEHERALAAVRERAKAAQSSIVEMYNAARLKNLDLELQLAAK